MLALTVVRERYDCCCHYVQEYLEENEEVSFDVFLEKVWDNIREIYRRPQTEAEAESEEEARDTGETENDSVPPETADVSNNYSELK